MTDLVGIALNIIPFLGGSIAAAVTAGAELAQGLQISDTVAGSLQVSIDMISKSSTFEQGILRCVSNSLRKEEFKRRDELLKILNKCGVTIDELQNILDCGIQRIDDVQMRGNDELNPTENVVENLGQSSIGDSEKDDKELCDEVRAMEALNPPLGMPSAEEENLEEEKIEKSDESWTSLN